MLLMQSANESSDLWAQYFLHRNRIGRDHMHFDIAGTKRRRHLKTDETGADHHRAP